MSGEPPDRSTPLDIALDLSRLRQYFNVALRTRDLLSAVREDVGFLDSVRRAVLPLPFDRHAPLPVPFPLPTKTPAGDLRGRRLGVVTTGGSGAMASLLGVVRALEEADLHPDVYSLCSGAVLFGFPLAAGMSATEAAELVLGLRPSEYVDVGWRRVAAAVPALGRGWGGLSPGHKVEEYYRRHLGDRTLGELRTPAYAPIWNVEANRLEFLGPRTHPDLPVARAVRMAVSLPLFLEPAELEGSHWCDGGIVDIFPVRPVLDIEAVPDTVVAVNGYYPPEFAGEDATGWQHELLSILHVASQVRTCQHIQLARDNLARLRAATDVVMLDPVPYRTVQGAGFYRQFLDTREWPQFMLDGRDAMLHALQARAAAAAPVRQAPG